MTSAGVKILFIKKFTRFPQKMLAVTISIIPETKFSGGSNARLVKPSAGIQVIPLPC
jgi:hypothetical protein